MVLVACFFLTLRRKLSSGQTFGRFVCLFVCLLDLHMILLRRKVQHCGQSENGYGQLHKALESGRF